MHEARNCLTQVTNKSVANRHTHRYKYTGLPDTSLATTELKNTTNMPSKLETM